MKRPETWNILLVEDNLGDARLTREAFKETGRSIQIEVVDNGEKAISYLRKIRGHEDKAAPDLILLDLNLPRKSGREVLAKIKEDGALKQIPVIVLTTSDSEADVTACYDLHANCFVCKPIGFEKFVEMIVSLVDFWCGQVQLPGRGHAR